MMSVFVKVFDLLWFKDMSHLKDIYPMHTNLYLPFFFLTLFPHSVTPITDFSNQRVLRLKIKLFSYRMKSSISDGSDEFPQFIGSWNIRIYEENNKESSFYCVMERDYQQIHQIRIHN